MHTANVIHVLTQVFLPENFFFSCLQDIKKVACVTVSLFFKVLCYRIQKDCRVSAGVVKVIRALHKDPSGGVTMEVLHS